LEAKLAAQAQSLADRVKARQLGSTSPEIQSFVKDMEEASKAMVESAQN